MNDNLAYQPSQPKSLFGRFFLVILIVAGIAGLALLVPPFAMSKSPATSATNVSLSGKISITFDLPLRRTALSFDISPKTEGALTYSNLIFDKHLARTIVYTPQSNLMPNTDYTVTISGIESYYNPFHKSNVLIYKFHSQTLPSIAKANLTEGQKNVPICDPIDLTLKGSNQNQVDFNFDFSPKVEFTETLSADFKKYTLTPTNCLSQGTAYTLTADRIIKSGSGDDLKYQLSFSTSSAPDVKSYSPTGDAVLVNSTKWLIEFAVPMNKSDVTNKILISPATAGLWSWPSETELDFTANQNLKYNTKYDILIPKGAKDAGRGFVSDDIHLAFKTIGAAAISVFSPANGAINIPVDSVASITFNQTVDKQSAESKVRLSPATEVNYSWNGNKLTLMPKSPLAKSTDYKILVDAGVKSISGTNSVSNYQSGFRTVENQVLLDIAQDYQDKALSCEAASLKMALTYRSLSVTETNIMDIVGFDPTVHSGNVWGNPNVAFVGDINGKQDTSGYGVYWDPIAKAADYYRPGSTAFSGGNIATLTDALSAGNPVIIWGTFGSSASADTWQTPDGKTISAWKGEHARLLTGYKGSSTDPTTFYLNDPIAGKITWTKATMLDNWGRFNNSGVIVK